MSNMSYCKFENTLSDLNDCYADLEGRDFDLDGADEDGNKLSVEELAAAIRLVVLCNKITDET